MYEGLPSIFAFMTSLSLKYFSFKTLATSEWGLVMILQSCLANVIRLKFSISLNPIHPFLFVV